MSRPREHHLPVTRTARYWTLGVADDVDDIWFVLHGYRQLARRFLRRFEPIARPGRLIVAPEGLSRFYVSSGAGRHGAESVVGASWMTREDRLAEIDDYVAYLDRLARRIVGDVVSHGRRRPMDHEELSGVRTPADRSPGRSVGRESGGGPSITVLGFSQGVATACRWLALGSLRADAVLLWGDFLPPDLDMARAERALDGVDVVLVRGSDDPALSSALADEEARRLERSTLRPRLVSYQGGHEIDRETLRALADG